MPVRNSPVLQGEFRISNDPGECLVTVLGSCVATCLWDDEAGVGGMNHFLLAGANVSVGRVFQRAIAIL